MKLGSSARPKDAARADVVFLDLYLSSEVPSLPEARNRLSRSVYDRARERAVEYLRSVRELTADDPTAVSPAFVLISSLGTASSSANFRKRAGQAMSRFRFVQKQTLATQEPHALLAIADIFRTCAACALIEPIHKAWPSILEDSRKWIETLLLELDISDFGRLYHLRLQKEGQPVDEYFKDLIAGALAERVSCAFTKLILPQSENPFENVPNFLEPPSNGFAELYSANRITQALGYRGPTALDPQSGDIYLDGPLPKTKSSSRLVGRKIFAVMSPPCDLIDRPGAGPAAKSVLLLQGTVHAVMNNEADPQIVLIGRRYYEIIWSLKHPQSITINVIREQKRKGRRIWLGRLKGEHFLALQASYLASLGRIGLMKSPAVFENLSGKISARHADNRVEIGSFVGTERFSFLCPDRGKQALCFAGNFFQYFAELLAGVRDGNQYPQSIRNKAKGILERMPHVLKMIEIRSALNHRIQNYLTVELHENFGQAIAEVGEGVIVIQLSRE